MMADPLKLGVFGAGAIGGYLGLRLAAGGAEVVLHGRQWLVDVADELCAFDLEGKRLAPSVRVVSDARALSEVDVCLVTVKSAQTLGAAEELREVLRPGALVVSFQNGLRNAERLRQTLREQTIVPGMVSFNVVIEGDKCFRQATSGPLTAGRVLDLACSRWSAWRRALAAAGYPSNSITISVTCRPASCWST